MKNKKIISIICALAMIFSMLSSLTAFADSKGIALDSTISKDAKTVTINATATGTTGNLSSFMISMNVPEGVTTKDVKVTSPQSLTTNVSVVNGVNTLQAAYLDLTGDGAAFADNKLATIEITLSEAIADSFTFTLQSDASIADEAGEVTVAGGMAASSTTVTNPSKPTPKPHTDATPAPVATDEPSDVPTPVAPTGKGIALAGSLDKTNKVVTIDATAAGTTGNLSSFMISLNVPEGIATKDVKVTSPQSLTTNVSVVNGVNTLQAAYLDLTGEGAAFADNKLATIEITLPEALTAPLAFTLQNDASIADEAGEVTVAGGMTAASTVVAPSTGDEKTSYDIPMKKAVGTADVADDELDNNGNSKYWIKAEVKKADGTDAAYGTDYVAEYNGTPLTKAQYENLINGHLGADNVKGLGADSIQDVIDNMTYKVYDKGTKVYTPVVQTATGDIVNDAKETTAGGKTETVTKPTLSVTPASKKVTSGTTVKVTTALKEVKEGGKLYVTADGGSWDAVAGSGIRVITPLTVIAEATTAAAALVPDTKTEISPDATVQFVAAVAGQKVILTYTYEGKNSDGTDATLEQKVTYTVTEKTVKGGGGSSSSSDDDDDDNSGSGSIATGNQGASNGAVTGIGFTDLGDVEWARTAINALALRNVVNGRGNGIFAPNDTITRAEYCQMVINAMGKANDSATSQFSDVSTDDWFYHNVAVASQLGIVVGFGDGTFHPYEKITREQMAVMTYKAVQVMGKGLASSSVSFSDDANIADWSRDSVYALAGAGIINGMGDGTFAPQANATRAQAAVIIYNALVK